MSIKVQIHFFKKMDEWLRHPAAPLQVIVVWTKTWPTWIQDYSVVHMCNQSSTATAIFSVVKYNHTTSWSPSHLSNVHNEWALDPTSLKDNSISWKYAEYKLLYSDIVTFVRAFTAFLPLKYSSSKNSICHKKKSRSLVSSANSFLLICLVWKHFCVRSSPSRTLRCSPWS